MAQEELQKLFDRYNRKYWRAQLPRYTVVISTRWHGGYCAKRLRVIFIHPDIAADDQRAKRTLLHEMSHASAPSGHGKLWKAEMRRLKRQGAPILETDITEYESSENVPTRSDILQGFYDAGLELPDETWAAMRRSLGYQHGLVDDLGRAEDRGVARFVEKCRHKFLKGQREAREMREARTEAISSAEIQRRSATLQPGRTRRKRDA